ncbi:MAG: helix-turn-helix domain-containing protein [Sphingosinicella sp.]|uniref:helix-turn-helix domain-containing protein n=1 Tax=Sphingosinicella sp. TaxID=1917971 RepID=UPI004037B405
MAAMGRKRSLPRLLNERPLTGWTESAGSGRHGRIVGTRRVGSLIPASIQFVRSLSHCDRVAFLMPGVRAALRCAKPEVTRDSGTDLPSRLRRRRRELGMFQKDVAQRLGVTPDTVLNWEKGRCRPPARYRSAIATFLKSDLAPVAGA